MLPYRVLGERNQFTRWTGDLGILNAAGNRRLIAVRISPLEEVKHLGSLIRPSTAVANKSSSAYFASLPLVRN